VFDHLDQEPWEWSAVDRRLADIVSRCWVNFARSGDPNGAGLPHWPAFSGESSRALEFGDEIVTRPAPVDPQLRTFDAVYDAVRSAPFGSSEDRTR
jgi:para-nitrobenzyl esterase